MIILLIKAPTGLDLSLPTDAYGNITASPVQQSIHDDMQAISAEWLTPVGSTATETLFRVIVRGTTLTAVKALIAKYTLPLTILHAQAAYETDSGRTHVVNGVDTPIMTTHVYHKGLKTDILPFMSDIVVYDMATGKETSRTKATVVTIPNCSDMTDIASHLK